MNGISASKDLDVRQSFWQKRVIGPVVGQLKQGITPEKVAMTIALGMVLGVFPILGSTTLLCAVAAAWFRLNQPIIQLVNYVAYPLQLILIIPMYRMGETLFQREHVPLSIPLIFERFTADFRQFLLDFGMIAVHGIVVWCILAPVVAAAIYFLTRPALRALARRVTG